MKEREQRLRIFARRKADLEEQVRECSGGRKIRAGRTREGPWAGTKDQEEQYVTCHHHHHHHMHYHHSDVEDYPNSEGQQQPVPQATLSIEAQRRCEAESENRVYQQQSLGQQAPMAQTAEAFIPWSGDDGVDGQPRDQMAHTLDDFVRNNATVNTIQQCASVAGLPKIPARYEKYNQNLRRTMGIYADSGKFHGYQGLRPRECGNLTW